MALDPFLLEILVCPETKEKVALAPKETLDALNALVAKGKLMARSGKPVKEPLEQALVRADGAVAYAVRDDIPVMLVDEAIPLHQVR